MYKQMILRCGIPVVLLLFLFCACAEGGAVRFSSLVPTKGENTYHNGYLGITVAVPEGMYISKRDTTNFTETPEESQDPDQLNRKLREDGTYSMEMISIQNRTSSTFDDHAELSVYAEQDDEYQSFSEYLADLEQYLLALTDDEYRYDMVDVGIVSVAGHDFWRLLVDVTVESTGDRYCQEYYVAQVKDYYLVVYVDYWQDNDDSRQDAYRMLQAVSIDGEQFGVRTQAI